MDYYRTLGVSYAASEDQIKHAYRRLAIRYHPDKNPDPAAEAIFKEVNEAYDVLSDPEKRKKEDQFGDLYVTFSIKIPTNLTDKQKALFVELSTM